MKSEERKKIKMIVAHISNDENNVRRVKEFSWIDDVNNIIHEPQIWLSMNDFRELCKIADIGDYLTVSLSDMRKYREMREN